ncbi:DMT family transporter [Sphingomonas gilva]|uniref:DMT family transporter n=1 Tax=Sphingomonas gilva TaxID=2305907 RepID=A0A396RM85_9SPHN|nr:DMT family transporter [Sphingomonas gilva]RHW17527.1 DMT family transporter [Sphingomonas gilva]
MRANPAIAFAVATAGIAVFASMDAVMKAQSLLIGAYSAMLWRTVFGVALSGAAFAVTRPRWPSRIEIKLHVARGAAAGVSVVLFFWGLTRVPMAQGVALTFIAPLIALFLAAVVLRERVGRTAVIASLIAFAGVLVILLGQARAEMGPDAFRGALAILAAAVLYAVNLILLRRQALAARPIEIAFFTNVVFLGVYAIGAPFLLVWPAPGQWPWLAFAAVLATVSILALAWAYARAEASYLAPVEYTAFIWASILGWLVFGERVQPLTVLGAALIVIGCVIAARRSPPPAPSVEAAM